MLKENDLLLSQLAVKIAHTETDHLIGSAVLYAAPHLQENIYVLTAAHCLYSDSACKMPLNQIILYFYSEKYKSYKGYKHIIDYQLVNADSSEDVAVLSINRKTIETLIETSIPTVLVSQDRQNIKEFVIKGFPKATNGKEVIQGEKLAVLHPSWLQDKPFQLRCEDDYTTHDNYEYQLEGMSGSGIFLHANDQIYLHGIYIRFRDAGKVIYGQYLQCLNALLEKHYLPILESTFFGAHGLTLPFFKNHIQKAIKDLGQRFSEKLNFQLPIAQSFDDMARNARFKAKLTKAFDLYLSKNYLWRAAPILMDLHPMIEMGQSKIHTFVQQIKWLPGEIIDIQPIINDLKEHAAKCFDKRTELYRLQSEQRAKDNPQKQDYHYRSLYESEIQEVRECSDAIHTLLENLNKIQINLANDPVWLITGKAGCGKSHLLGDIATRCMSNNQPILLCLGQHFKATKTVEENILSQLDCVGISYKQFLETLNAIGQQIGSRVLLLIDALNEGDGNKIWRDALAGFIESLKAYPFIGLVLTVRDKYFDSVIPKSLQETIQTIEHQGFIGNEYEALRLFCEYYGLQQPQFPLLNREFSNPLLLHLICKGVQNTPKKNFPQGFQGVTTIFNFYLDAVVEQLVLKNSKYKLLKSRVREAIDAFAECCLQTENHIVLLDDAIELFDNQRFKCLPDFLEAIINEGVLIQNQRYNGDEIVYFAYQRLGDFKMAEKLLSPYKTAAEIKFVFEHESKFRKLLENRGQNHGMWAALAILLPEKYNLEITEVYDWLLIPEKTKLYSAQDDQFYTADEYYRYSRHRHYEYLCAEVVESIQWRTLKSIDNQKITNIFDNNKSNIGEKDWLNLLISMATVPQHLFNGDRLHRYLKPFSMPKRDAFWLQYLVYYSGKDDEYTAPLARLMDWAWQPNISPKIDMEMARLAGQTLAWVLASSYIQLRDQATKAMVNLLEEQSDALLAILTAFESIDEPYIAERLYAVAYGCTLRTEHDSAVARIAQYVFDTIFKDGNPPVHVLLRDYARNIVEYAIYKKLKINVNESLIRPPYRSKMPKTMPTLDDIKQYKSNYDDRENRNFMVYHSVTDWDFGRYVINSAVSNFCAVNFNDKVACEKFIKELITPKKKLLKLLKDSCEMVHTFNAISETKKQAMMKSFGQTNWQTFAEVPKDNLQFVLSIIPKSFNEQEQAFILNKCLPYFEALLSTKGHRTNHLDATPIQYWIVQKVFELGYDSKIHAEYDRRYADSEYQGTKIERIGKKYQWIAFHEIIARIADNYKLGFTYTGQKEQAFQGTWQLYLRNIDPVFITKNKVSPDNGLEDIEHNYWYSKPNYNYWSQTNTQWIDNQQDIPNPIHLIQAKDDQEQEWLYLEHNTNWKEPKSFGGGVWERNRMIRYEMSAYLIPRKDKNKIKLWLQKQDKISLPNAKLNSCFFTRENYWSSAALSEKQNEKTWQKVTGTTFKVIVTTENANGENSNDKSEAYLQYQMPCKTIMEGLQLQYDKKDSFFKNQKDEIVAFSFQGELDYMERGTLVRKNDFLNFLMENDLEIIWTVYGDKYFTGMTDRENNLFSIITGAYAFDEKGVLDGSIKIRRD